MADLNETTLGDEGSSRSAGDKVKDSAHEAQEKASKVAAKARDKGEHLAEEGREKAEELAHKAGDMARTRADEERSRVAGGIRTVADALRRGSEDLPEDRKMYGRFVETVADRADGLSRYLETHEVDEMAREAKRLAREHTGVMLSGAFALGILGARFLKSSSDEAQSERWVSRGYAGDTLYDSGYRTSGGYAQPGGQTQPGGFSRGEVYHAGERGAASSTERDRAELGGDGLGARDVDLPGTTDTTDDSIDRLGGRDA